MRRQPPTHTFDEGMKCIRCRREYARRAEVCDGPETADNRNLGALAKRNAYRERMADIERELDAEKFDALAGMIR